MSGEAKYYVSKVMNAPNIRPSSDRHVAFESIGWEAFAVAPYNTAEQTVLRWDPEYIHAVSPKADVRLRLSVSVDHHREDALIEAMILSKKRVVGTFDVRFPTVCQPLEIALSPEDVRAIVRDGIGLRVIQGEDPVWFITETGNGHRIPDALMPHLMVADNVKPEREFFRRMLSGASIQPFGWLEGCVLDGLFDLEELLGRSMVRPVIEDHLHHYFDQSKVLSYVTSTSRLVEGRVYGVEGVLTFAVMARVWRDHPSIVSVIQFLESRQDDSGLIAEGALTAEGCYTLAYPLATFATLYSRPDLAQMAINQLRFRNTALYDGNVFYPQIRKDGTRPFKNWGRGAVWFLLGYVRTMAALIEGGAKPPSHLYDECRQFAAWIVSMQQDDGTWCAFVDDPSTGCDTSATSGLGAAIAIGVNMGILSDSYIDAAYRTLNGLLSYLTPDGFLRSSAPENKGREPLERREHMQRFGPRGISQMSMGLMTQLIAALATYVEQRGLSKRPDSIVHRFFNELIVQ